MNSAVVVPTACAYIFGCVIDGPKKDAAPEEELPQTGEPLTIPVPPQLQVGDKLLNLAGPTGERCVASTPDGDIVLERASGTMFLPAKYAKTDIFCQMLAGGERILNIGPPG